MSWCSSQEICSANDLCDSLIVVVENRREVVGRHTVIALDDEIVHHKSLRAEGSVAERHECSIRPNPKRGRPVLCSIYAGCAGELVPPENRFDPTDPRQFDELLTRAVRGQVAPADDSRLWRCREVAEAIADDVQAVLEPNPRTEKLDNRSPVGSAVR